MCVEQILEPVEDLFLAASLRVKNLMTYIVHEVDLILTNAVIVRGADASDIRWINRIL